MLTDLVLLDENCSISSFKQEFDTLKLFSNTDNNPMTNLKTIIIHKYYIHKSINFNLKYKV